jgi:alanine dehydrogenase
MIRKLEPTRIPPVLMLNRSTISELLSLQECVPAVEAAFAAYARRETLAPVRLHVEADRGEFHIKAGGLRGSRTYFALKINAGFFHNRRDFDLPNIVGLILLCDGATGVPLAVMESGWLTRLRTGAATAVAAKYLAKRDSRAVTICGAGIQADIQLRALKTVLPIEQVFVWSRSGAASFAATVRAEIGIAAEPVTDLRSATLVSDVIVTCTPAHQWFLGREHVRSGTFIAAIGADSPDKQELEPELLAKASVVPDLLSQAAEVGDLHHAIAANLIKPQDIRGELGEVITGTAPPRTHDKEIIVFDSTGTALQDVAAAATTYERATLLGRGKSVALWE